MPARGRPADLIALVIALETDDSRSGLEFDQQTRHRRDRAIGTRVLGQSEDSGHVDLTPARRTALLAAWLDEVPRPEVASRIAHVRSAFSILGGSWIVVAALLGWAASMAVLSIEFQGGRINVVFCLGVLVCLPVVSFVLSGVSLLRPRAVRPGGVDTTGFGLISSVLLGASQRLLPQATREDLEILLGRAGSSRRLYSGVARAQLYAWLQASGLAFGLASLGAALVMVAFTDLAFGWSTTLDVEAGRVARMARALAWPWHLVWPDAVPSLELVETTRFFRVSAHGSSAPSSNASTAIDPLLYGGWWPFLVGSITTYSVLPRVVSLVFGRLRLARLVDSAVLATPGVDALLDRLTLPLVESRAAEIERATGSAAIGAVPIVSLASGLGLGSEKVDRVALVEWAEASIGDADWAAYPEVELARLSAGGRCSIEEDDRVIATLADSEHPIGFAVHAHEPPVLEILDFLAALRGAVGDSRPLAVLLIGGRPVDREAWQRKLTTLSDPGLRIVLADEARDG